MRKALKKMDTNSSRIKIKILFEGEGETTGELKRFSSPLTVETILKKLPLVGRAHPIKGGSSFILGIKRGVEKSVKSVKRGTIAYWPMGDALCFFYEDTNTYSPVNKIGEIFEGTQLIKKIKSGKKIRVEKVS
jgi:hypothetical protein